MRGSRGGAAPETARRTMKNSAGAHLLPPRAYLAGRSARVRRRLTRCPSASAMLTNLFSVQGGFWGATGTVAAPVLNARKFAEVSVAEAKQKAAYANYLQAVKSAFSDVDSQLTSMQIANQKQADLLAANKAAQRLTAINVAQYKAGVRDIRFALEAEAEAIESERLVNGGSARQLSQLVTVFQSLASGYAVTASK